MSEWTIITDNDDNVEYAALLKGKALYDLRARVKGEPFSVGDIYCVQIDRYHPSIKGYSAFLTDNTPAHLPKRHDDNYSAGDIVIAQIRRLFDGDKDILLTTNIDTKETDLFTFEKSSVKKLISAPSLSRILTKQYSDLDLSISKANFDDFDLWSEIENCKNKTISIKDGISISIDQTTALTAIDVNSTGQVSVTKANIIAATEISRQIRIQNLGGIIIVDFINMKESHDKKGVQSKLKKLTQDDPCDVHIYGFTALNLLEMTRKRVGNPISSILR